MNPQTTYRKTQFRSLYRSADYTTVDTRQFS